MADYLGDMDLAIAQLLADWDGHMDGWGAGGWILMSVGMLVFWAIVIFAFVWIARSYGGVGGRQMSAQDVLERRLAEGEITVAEYRERKAALDS